MLKKLLLKALQEAIQEAVESGKVGELISKLLADLLKGNKLSITVEGSPVNDGLKDLLFEALLNVVRQLLDSGKLTDILLKLLQGFLGTKNFTLPIVSTECHDVEIETNTLAFTHNDGTVYRIDFSDLLS